jgi:hypothetical protein
MLGATILIAGGLGVCLTVGDLIKSTAFYVDVMAVLYSTGITVSDSSGRCG